MTYKVSFGKEFAKESVNYPKDQKQAIADFVNTFQNFGLADYSKYQGKISPSWSGINMTQESYDYAYTNHLWHYHLGIPSYKNIGQPYYTSDYILHFQWKNRGNEIALLDCSSHYTSTKIFYLPPERYLVKIK